MITSYATLKTDVAGWLNRTNLTSKLGDFVQIAESNIRRDLEVRTQELIATGSLTGETLAFPTRYSELRRLKVGDRLCRYLTPEHYALKDFQNAGAPARWYTIIGESFYILDGAATDTYELVYSQWFASLSADGDTNWVLTNAPDVYLWGSCFAGAVYLKDVNAAAGYKGLYDAAVKALKDKEKAAKWAGVPMMIRPETVERC